MQGTKLVQTSVSLIKQAGQIPLLEHFNRAASVSYDCV